MKRHTAPGMAPPPRDAWVFCGGMIRAGSTLQYQMASELVERAGLGRRCGWRAPEDIGQALAGGPPRGLATLKTHVATPEVLAACRDGTGVALYVFRDLRDVIGSYQQKNGLVLEGEALESFARYLVAVDGAWRDLGPLRVARYEDMTADLAGEIARLAAALGVEAAAPGGLAGELADELAYARQKARTLAISGSPATAGGPNAAYDPGTLLHADHFQSGRAGRHVEDLTAAQQEAIRRAAGPWLEEHGYV